MKIQLRHNYKDIIFLDNLCLAWQEFVVGKKQKNDVQIFSRDLMDNILSLHEDLVNTSYRHGGYESFFVNDPKRRHIHKASVRDRLLHHAIYRILYPFFDKTFTADSFSCRLDKGTHKATDRLQTMFFQVNKNNTRVCWVLKCDIRKFFDSIDHQVLLNKLAEYISDKDIMFLLENIVESYRKAKHPLLPPPRRGGGSQCPRSIVPSSMRRGEGRCSSPVAERLDSRFRGNDSEDNGVDGEDGMRVGLPLGNLTSQLFANVYMNVFDQWVKHKLKVKYYIRYADDFLFLSPDKQYLEDVLFKVRVFLKEVLKLDLHPNKIFLETFSSGIDFLGWVNFSNHRILRKNTEKRLFRRIKENPKPETLQSYLGLLKHGNTFKLEERLLVEYWVCR